MKVLKLKECEVIMKDNFNEDIDKKITQFLNDETRDMSVADDTFFKIRGGILKEKREVFLI